MVLPDSGKGSDGLYRVHGLLSGVYLGGGGGRCRKQRLEYVGVKKLACGKESRRQADVLDRLISGFVGEWEGRKA